jgi:hypothetical protein
VGCILEFAKMSWMVSSICTPNPNDIAEQALAERFHFPSAFDMQYRDVVHCCLEFTMAALSAFIWYGGAIAELGPAGFKKLWANLQPALWHYLYNRHASTDDMHAGARHLRAYAEDLEGYVIQGWVCNLPMAVSMCVRNC